MDLKQLIDKAKAKDKRIWNQGIYNEKYLNKTRQESLQEILTAKNDLYKSKIAELEKKKNAIIRSYDPEAAGPDPEKPKPKQRGRYDHLPEDWAKLQEAYDKQHGLTFTIPEEEETEPTQQERPAEEKEADLLKMQKLQTKIKAARTQDLEKKIDEIQKTSRGDLDEINIIAAELRNRGKNEQADNLMVIAEHYNLNQPWLQDPDYQRLEQKQVEYKMYADHDDIIFLENGDYVPVERIFKHEK